MARQVVIGADSSTQSTKVLAVDVETGEVVSEGRAPHSGADTQDPRDWWAALHHAFAESGRAGAQVVGISVAGQQHGLVTIGADGEPVRPAPLWNNVDAAPDADRLNELADFAAAVGSQLVASFTISKLAHLARTAPGDLEKTGAICLPHDYLNWKLTGHLASDRGEASGSGWWSAAENRVRPDLLALAVGDEHAQRLVVPDVLGPDEVVGRVTFDAAAYLGMAHDIPVAPGSGDNPAAAVGIGATDQEIVVSLGTSGTAYIVSNTPTADTTGEVCGFADATGRFLPLACMLNCTRIVDSVAGMLGIDRIEALDRAGRVEPGAGGLLMLPYFGGERTPNLPNATGYLSGLTAENTTPDLLLRAAVDGVAAGVAYMVEALERLGVTAPAVTLVGGGSQHATWRQAIADVTGLPVAVRAGSEHVARGAAIQAAAIVRGEKVANLAEAWRPAIVTEVAPRAGLREAFRLPERRELIQGLARR